MKKASIITMSVVLFVLGTLFSISPALWADEAGDNPSPAATSTPLKTTTPTTTKKVDLPPLFLAEIKNEVYIVHKGDKKKADPPQKVEKDDRIITGKDSKAYLEFKEGGTIEVGPESDVKINELEINDKTFKARFQIAVGKMKTFLHKLMSSSSHFEVEAGGVIAGVRGTTFEVDYDKDKKEAAAKTYEGTVYTRSNGKEQLVEKGFSLVVGRGGSPTMGKLSLDDVNDFVDFMNAADKLEKAKEILLKQLEKRLLDQLTKGLLGQTDDGKPSINLGHFGF